MLVYALTATAPYARDSDEAILWAHLNAPPPVDDVPGAFADLVGRALAKDPSDRFPSAGDLGRTALAGAASPADEETQAPSLTAVATAPATATPDRRRTARRLAGVALAIVALVALAVAVLADDGGRPPAPPAPANRPSQVDPPLPYLNRPNALTVTGNEVWAMSGRGGEIVIIDARTNDVIDRLQVVGSGGSSIAAGFGSVWVVKTTTRTLIRLGARTHELIRAGSPQIAVPGRAWAVATGGGAVWVGLRNTNPRARSPETVVRVDPRTLEQRPITIPIGVQDLTFGAGALWVTNRFKSTVTRIRANDERRDVIPVGGQPTGIATGFGSIWVASKREQAITRINPRTLATSLIPLDAEPTRVAAGGGSVWVTSRAGGQLLRIDPRRRRVVERINTATTPFALDVHRPDAIWLTLLNKRAVQRVRFYG